MNDGALDIVWNSYLKPELSLFVPIKVLDRAWEKRTFHLSSGTARHIIDDLEQKITEELFVEIEKLPGIGKAKCLELSRYTSYFSSGLPSLAIWRVVLLNIIYNRPHCMIRNWSVADIRTFRAFAQENFDCPLLEDQGFYLSNISKILGQAEEMLVQDILPNK